jgi:hypothetical protein
MHFEGDATMTRFMRKQSIWQFAFRPLRGLPIGNRRYSRLGNLRYIPRAERFAKSESPVMNGSDGSPPGKT